MRVPNYLLYAIVHHICKWLFSILGIVRTNKKVRVLEPGSQQHFKFSINKKIFNGYQIC